MCCQVVDELVVAGLTDVQNSAADVGPAVVDVAAGKAALLIAQGEGCE